MNVDPETTIIAPDLTWCDQHWGEVIAVAENNSVFCAMRIITRTFELERFHQKCYPAGGHKAATDVARINEVLREIAPICCWLGDEEMSLIRAESRSIGKRMS